MGDRKNWKPQSYSSVSPYLVVAGAQKVIDFLKAVFGATELRRYDMPDGSIMHAEVRIDDTVIMLGDGGAAFPSFTSLIHVYVDDIDRVYERAIEAGGTPVEAPRTREAIQTSAEASKIPAGTRGPLRRSDRSKAEIPCITAHRSRRARERPRRQRSGAACDTITD